MLAGMCDALEETGRHQTHRGLRIDARATSLLVVQIARSVPQPREVQNLVNPFENVIVGNQVPQRCCNK